MFPFLSNCTNLFFLSYAKIHRSKTYLCFVIMLGWFCTYAKIHRSKTYCHSDYQRRWFCTYVKIHRSKTLTGSLEQSMPFCTYVKIHRSKTSNMYFSMKLTQIFIKFYFCCKIIVYWLKTAATIQLISLLEYIYNRFVDFSA